MCVFGGGGVLSLSFFLFFPLGFLNDRDFNPEENMNQVSVLSEIYLKTIARKFILERTSLKCMLQREMIIFFFTVFY